MNPELMRLMANPAFVKLMQELGVWAVGASGDKTVSPRVSISTTGGQKTILVEMGGPAMSIELKMIANEEGAII